MWSRLQSLPRDTRDTLFLLAVITWILLPQIEYLPIWCSAMAGIILVWRGVIAWRGQALPSRWWLFVLLIVTALATYFSYRTLLGRDAGTTFIVVLLALKTLELRARRDAFVVFFLGFFTLLSNFFFSQSLVTAAFMLLGLLGLLTALVNSHMPVGKPPLLQSARMAGKMALLGTPIMLALFMLFPRMAPLWGVPEDAMRGRSGLSGSMQVGTIASLALDSSIAMRIRFEGEAPQRSDMYFRGPVLSSFDGREWRPLRSAFPANMQPAVNLQVRGAPVDYQVTLEGNNRPWLLTLDATPASPEISRFKPTMASDLQWTVDRPVSDLVRYRAKSYMSFTHGPDRMVTALQDYVALPPGYNPRTLQLAADIRRDPRYASASGGVLVQAIMERLRTGGYTYTLEPGVYGRDTADEFWFDRKQGFCEHIASSFVLLMRALDVPARVVTGYQGGERNAVDGFWVVRQSDAHAWAEVWIAGQGWVRVDPTSAVAPGRTGTAQRLEASRGVIAQALVNVNPAFALNLRAMWEAANNRWNQWVLNYSQANQLDLLRNLGFESPSWQDLSTVLLALIIGVSLIGAAWTQWERHQQDPWLRLLRDASKRLGQAGYLVPDNASPRALATAMLAAQPESERLAALRDWLLRLEACRYAPDTTAMSGPSSAARPTLAQLRREFGQLHWPERRPETL